MSQAKYLDAAQDLRCLQGTKEFASLENPKMGSEEFAKIISDNYRIDTLIKARQILDTEQDLQTLNEKEPVKTTLDYGGMTREWLERQQSTKQAVKHPMVTKEEPKEEPASAADTNELNSSITEMLGKVLPDDPNLQLLMWQELADLQKKLKVLEMDMRKKMAAHFFPSPTEGTNTVDIGKGWKVKLKHTINRTADEAAFEGVFEELNKLGDEAFQKEDLFKFKPELKKAQYNKFSDKQKGIFDQCLIIKPGSPAIEVVAPKEEK